MGADMNPRKRAMLAKQGKLRKIIPPLALFRKSLSRRRLVRFVGSLTALLTLVPYCFLALRLPG
jgi:hypothetical protein